MFLTRSGSNTNKNWQFSNRLQCHTLVHTEEVPGSIPGAPTNFFNSLENLRLKDLRLKDLRNIESADTVGVLQPLRRGPEEIGRGRVTPRFGYVALQQNSM